ncbi:MBL fold hydrolase [Spirochaetia bacterium]|nr:MBL fold hydrolase [Spirochaetia bacterium]
MMNYTITPVIVGALETNCWIYPLNVPPELVPPDGETPCEAPCAVIDPGADPEAIIARIEALHLWPQYLLLTHGHFDHVTALGALAKKYPAAVIAIHRDDVSYLSSGSVTVGKLLAEGDVLGPFTVLHLPGHTPGGVGFYDAKAGLLFSGDTLFRQGVGRTDFPGGDSRKLGESLKRLFSLDGETVVCPGHGPATTIAEERGYYEF